MKSFIFAASLLIGSFAFAHSHGDSKKSAHLEFAGGKVHAHTTWEVGPKLSEESKLKIEWKNGADHTAIAAPGSFEVVLWMPSMGHGSAPTQIARVANSPEGVFMVTGAYFVMGGDWDVNVNVTFPDGSKETQTIKVELSDEGGHHGHH